MTEFDLITHYFATQNQHRSDVIQNIGDDAAIVSPPKQHELAITTDTLVAGVHFLETTSPYDIAYKSLAVNLSDLAAMGATPAWVTLAITLPKADEDWIQAFCSGFFTLANRYQVQLIGGDLTHGPLSITVQAIGFIPCGQGIRRSQAKPDDLIYVTGTLGDAGLALQYLQDETKITPEHLSSILLRLNRPEPRIQVGEQLRNVAHAAIDISDGLVADLNHILTQSQVGATLFVDSLPLSEELKHLLSIEKAHHLALTAGDDYELCFTIPKHKQSEFEAKLSRIPCRYTCIGTINKKPGLNLCYQDGTLYQGPTHGYQHF